MKRFLPLLLAVAALTAPAISQAAVSGTPKAIDVGWVQNRAANPAPGRADSVAMRSIGTAVPTAHDTSTAIDIRRFLPNAEFADGATAMDSLSYLRVELFPLVSTPTVGADTLFISFQVSMDGVTAWNTCTPTQDALGASDTPAPDTIAERVLEQGTSNDFFVNLTQVAALGRVLLPARSSATALTTQQIYGWPYMRIIVQGDKTGRYDAKVFGYVPDDDAGSD